MRVRNARAIATTQVVVGSLGLLLSATLWTRRGEPPMMQSVAFSLPIVTTAGTLLWRRLLSQMLERLENEWRTSRVFSLQSSTANQLRLSIRPQRSRIEDLKAASTDGTAASDRF